MASLRVLVVSALLACVLADTLAQGSLKELADAAELACGEVYDKLCAAPLCKLQHMGILDKDGRYVDSKAAEILRLAISDPSVTQEQINTIAKGCNSLNEHINTDCDRSAQVIRCFKNEANKMSPQNQAVLKIKL